MKKWYLYTEWEGVPEVKKGVQRVAHPYWLWRKESPTPPPIVIPLPCPCKTKMAVTDKLSTIAVFSEYLVTQCS